MVSIKDKRQADGCQDSNTTDAWFNKKSLLCPHHSCPPHQHSSVLSGLRGRIHSFLKYNFQLSHANEQPNKLNEFSSFKFLWGFIQNSLLPLQLMKARKKTHLAAAPFMKDLFHTDACLWVWLCCQTLIPALLLHYNWDTSRGDMYIWVCVHLEPSVVNYRLHVRACVWTRTPLWGAVQWLWASPCSARSVLCGVSHPGSPPQYGTSQSLSSITCHGSSLWPVHL